MTANRSTRATAKRWTSQTLALALTVALLSPPLPSQQTTGYTFHAETDLVLVNVTVRDKSGNFVRDLKQGDFTVVEDSKTQQVISFDIENTDALPPANVEQTKLLDSLKARPSGTQASPNPAPANAASAFKDRRLIILFFDLTSMQPDEIDRAAKAAENYVDKQMQPADLVSVVSLGSSLLVNQDFTSDHDLLQKTLHAFNAAAGQGFEEGATSTTEGTPDTGQAFTQDDTEYNIFNTDRRLEALRSIGEQLSRVDQKKSLIYFSSGMNRTGVENQSELHAAVNAAVRANLSIYTLDIRGLQAMVPGGEAQSASMRGTSAYSGRATQNQYNANFSSQETLVTLAGDTGGRAFLDSNDFSKIFRGVQEDTSTYYVLGYHSSNPARDGRYRHIAVQINRPGLKLEYRRGYYAPADFQHATHEDRERQLEEELASELPSTDLPVYLSTGYFRLADNKFFVPLSVVLPGSAIPFTRNGEQDKATLDVIAVVLDESKQAVSQVRDTVKLALNTSAEVQRKNVQYDAGLLLPPGKYHLKLVVRENQSGQMGSFETDLVIPDMKTTPLKMSSVVLASQIQPSSRKSDNPLVRDGSELIPNVTHVFSSGQHLYFYYEVYDPARDTNSNSTAGNGPAGKAAATSAAPNSQATNSKAPGNKAAIHVLTNVAFFRGKTKAYETPLVEAKEINVPNRHASVFQLDVPLTELKPGFYTCQINVIDDAAGHFLFPRLALLVRQ
ncbi:MAG TPA: VWA domain-containing protein [Terriglobales bacterium]|nr:VWA domain-containing protein [Terriglobales bacterium]